MRSLAVDDLLGEVLGRALDLALEAAREAALRRARQALLPRVDVWRPRPVTSAFRRKASRRRESTATGALPSGDSGPRTRRTKPSGSPASPQPTQVRTCRAFSQQSALGLARHPSSGTLRLVSLTGLHVYSFWSVRFSVCLVSLPALEVLLGRFRTAVPPPIAPWPRAQLPGAPAQSPLLTRSLRGSAPRPLCLIARAFLIPSPVLIASLSSSSRCKSSTDLYPASSRSWMVRSPMPRTRRGAVALGERARPGSRPPESAAGAGAPSSSRQLP